MKINNPILKVIISTGGTGGHIFPALAVADKLKYFYPNINILFVGAQGKMEMDKVQQMGYDIVGLNIQGYDRKNIFKNITLVFKIIQSFFSCFRIIKSFKPDIVVGFGGYASFIVLRSAQFYNIPTAIHEQNSIAGKTNKILSKRAKKIFVAYRGMEKFFNTQKILFTGNPIRQNILNISKVNIELANQYFNFRNPQGVTILIIGGSLGSRSINTTIYNNLKYFRDNKINLIWQCGNNFEQYQNFVEKEYDNIILIKFIDKMELAYSKADLIISRAGALSVSELALVGKAVIFVPFPYAAENHQTINARYFVAQNAGTMIPDDKLSTLLIPTIRNLITNKNLLSTYATNIKRLAVTDATEVISESILHLVDKNALKNINNLGVVFFMGIGGIGMSALARFCLKNKIRVLGYDKYINDETKALEKLGVKIYNDQVNFHLLPKHITCIVYTPAVPIATPIFQHYLKQFHIIALKRSQFLGKITQDNFNICVAGTHGKTSISAMLSYVLYNTEIKCNAFLGGIALNFNSNLIFASSSDINVIEADEYDKSFLQLSPNIIIISSMDSDHLEIYGTHADMVHHYFKFLDKLKPNGLLVINYELTIKYNFSKYNFITYSTSNPKADYYTKNIHTKGLNTTFKVYCNHEELTDIRFNKLALFNVENSLPVIAVSHFLELKLPAVKDTLLNFKGVKRRFQIVISNNKHTYIDDYAHHPEELQKSIESVKKMFPNKKITMIFQPHLFSRTKILADEFVTALTQVDNIILLPIYPAREKPILGITSAWLLRKIKNTNKQILQPHEVLTYLSKHKEEQQIIMTVGAGNIDQMVQPIKDIITNNPL